MQNHLPSTEETGPEDFVKRFLSKNRRFTRKEFQDTLGLSKSSARSILSEMIQNGLITKDGDGPSTTYIVTDQYSS